MTLTTLPVGIVAEDYERIEAAVMETARGRWFLMEYARRQRSAETARLVDAVARLEARIASLARAPLAASTNGEAETPPIAATPPGDSRLFALSRLDRLSLEDKLSLFS